MAAWEDTKMIIKGIVNTFSVCCTRIQQQLLQKFKN